MYDFLKQLLLEKALSKQAVIFVLDDFDAFAHENKQSKQMLLYNLLDWMQVDDIISVHLILIHSLVKRRSNRHDWPLMQCQYRIRIGKTSQKSLLESPDCRASSTISTNPAGREKEKTIYIYIYILRYYWSLDMLIYLSISACNDIFGLNMKRSYLFYRPHRSC